LSRTNIIKWLLERLLSSFVTSVIIYLTPILGINLQNLGFGIIYTIITIVTFTVSIFVHFLVPREKEKIT